MRLRCAAVLSLMSLAVALPAGAAEPGAAAPPQNAAPAEPAEPRPAPLDAALLSFVIELMGTQYVVIARPAEEAWAAGDPVVLSREQAALRRAVAKDALPAAHAAWAGRALSVFGRDGAARCRATVAELHVLLYYEPHFGTINRWTASDGQGPAPDDAAVAKEAGELGRPDEDLWLVGRLAPEGGGACDGAVWARAADRPAATLFAAAAEPDEGRRKAALKHFRGLAAWKAAQARYKEHPTEGKGKRWDEHGGMQPAVLVMAGPGDVRWVWAGADIDEGCGGFFDELWVIWEVRGEGPKATWTPLVIQERGDLWFSPLHAVDVDADGRPEFVGPDDLVRPVGPTWQRVEDVEPNSYDCPC